MKELKKQHLEMLQVLESIEIMLQNGDSIHPDSVIRGAIQTTIGMDINLNNKKQTAVEWLNEQMNNIKGSSISMNGTVQFIEKELNNLLQQAKEIEIKQREELYNETEVLQLLIKLKQTESFDNLYDWFNQNKKNNL